MKGRKKVLKVERDMDDETEQLFLGLFQAMEGIKENQEKIKRLKNFSIKQSLILIIVLIFSILSLI